MDFEWDIAKSATNRKKHGYSFEVVQFARWEFEVHFDTQLIDGEEREQVLVPAGNRLLSVIRTLRGEKFRIISVRRATKSESDAWRRQE